MSGNVPITIFFFFHRIGNIPLLFLIRNDDVLIFNIYILFGLRKFDLKGFYRRICLHIRDAISMEITGVL